MSIQATDSRALVPLCVIYGRGVAVDAADAFYIRESDTSDEFVFLLHRDSLSSQLFQRPCFVNAGSFSHGDWGDVGSGTGAGLCR